MRSREYSETLTVDYKEIRDAMKAQKEIWKSGIVKLDRNRLMSALSAVSSILGLVFVANTPASIVAAITGLVASLAPDEHEELEDLVQDGYMELGDLRDFLEEHPQYDLMKVELPFIEFKVDGKTIRFVTGAGLIKQLHTKNGWIRLDD